MTSQYENLAEFIGSYFHQDWTNDASSSLDVVKIYLSEWPRKEALLAFQELVLLLSTEGETELQKAIEGMGCYFSPAAEGYASFTDWMRHVEQAMRQSLGVAAS